MAERKVINFNKTVFELSLEHPEFTDVMKDVGFPEIITPGLLSTAGRFMTVPRGAKMKGLDFDSIRQAFVDRGFDIIEAD